MSLPFFQQSPSGIAVVQALSPAAWFRYGVGLTDDGAGLCSNWSDQSGNGRDLKATLTARPTIQADKSLLFDGVANSMNTGAIAITNPQTIYMLMNQVTWTSNDCFLGASAGVMQIQQAGSSPTIQLFGGSGVANNNNLTVGAFAVVAAVFNGASSSLQVNNTAATTGSAGTGSASNLFLGSQGVPGGFSNIQVKEVIVYAAAHDAATRSRVISYLGSVGAISV